MHVNEAVPPIDHPRSAGPAGLESVPHRMVAGLGAAWILDGLQITISSSVTGAAKPADPGNDLDRGWADRIRVSDRGDDRRTGVWQDVGSAGPRRLIVTLLLYLLGTEPLRS